MNWSRIVVLVWGALGRLSLGKAHRWSRVEELWTPRPLGSEGVPRDCLLILYFCCVKQLLNLEAICQMEPSPFVVRC